MIGWLQRRVGWPSLYGLNRAHTQHVARLLEHDPAYLVHYVCGESEEDRQTAAYRQQLEERIYQGALDVVKRRKAP